MTVNLMIKAQTTRKLISREHVCGAEEYLTRLAVHVGYNSRRDGQSLYNHTHSSLLLNLVFLEFSI